MQTSKFPHHLDCETLTGLTLDHLPRDGSLGRVRRFTKGTHLWQSDDDADRIYFLRRGRVAVMTATPENRPVLLRTIEADHSLGELCMCTARPHTRGTTASALIACEAIEIKLTLGNPSNWASCVTGSRVAHIFMPCHFPHCTGPTVDGSGEKASRPFSRRRGLHVRSASGRSFNLPSAHEVGLPRLRSTTLDHWDDDVVLPYASCQFHHLYGGVCG
jgi:Cyclic nucleotide-binding domain